MTPLVSIVIPCSAAHAGVLRDCLDSLRAQRFDSAWEVIVVNSHGSQDVETAARESGARHVAPGGAEMAGVARNAGVAASRGELLAFIDADCTAMPGWLRALSGALAGGAVAVGGPVLNEVRSGPVAIVDNLMQFVDQAPGRPAGTAREFPGCNMAVRRAVFQAAGGYPEIPTGEDTALSQTISRMWPGQTPYLPSMSVRHRGRAKLPDFIAHQRELGFSRGRFGFNLSARQQALGRRALFAALGACRRLAYFYYRAVTWHPVSLPGLILYTPILIVGLAAWSQGFNRGCRLAGSERAEADSNSRQLPYRGS